MLDAICVFADEQDISDAAAKVSSNVFDLEKAESGGSAIVTDNQVVGWLNIKFYDAVSFTGGDSGIEVRLRTGDNSDMSTGAWDIAATGIILPARVLANSVFSVGVCASNLGTFLGVWWGIVSEQFAGDLKVSAWLSPYPIGASNHGIQKNLT